MSRAAMESGKQDEANRDRAAAVVGANLRRLRQERRMSLSEVSRLSGIAKATLSNLEGGSGNPTIMTLVALADVLGVLPGDLMAEQAPRLIRATDGPFVKGPITTGRLITRHHSSSIDLHEVTFKANRTFQSVQPSSDALEQVYVISGTLRIEVDTEQFLLGEGDFIQYPLHEGAQITAVDEDAKVILIMAYTHRGARATPPFSDPVV